MSAPASPLFHAGRPPPLGRCRPDVVPPPPLVAWRTPYRTRPPSFSPTSSHPLKGRLHHPWEAFHHAFLLYCITPCNAPPRPLCFLSEVGNRRRVIAVRSKPSTAADSTSLVSTAPGHFPPPSMHLTPPPRWSCVAGTPKCGHRPPESTRRR
jgi:hypothetical protein